MALQNADLIDQFPILKRETESGNRLIYLDSAATTLKPQCVIDAVTDVLTNRTANIHRSVHFLGDEATHLYEKSRDMTAMFINATASNIIFLRNTTEALNLVARCFVREGRVITSYAEHHSNYLPWEDNVHRLKVDQNGQVDLEELEQELSKKDVSLVSLSHISNVTGNILDIKKICELAHSFNAKVLIDAAQSAPHVPIDVEDLDVDFLAFSGHKLGAPTGVGVLYGKIELLEQMDMFHKGGSTIESIDGGQVQLKNAPWKFEAGTPAVESVVGLSAALEFLMDTDMDRVNDIFNHLSEYTYKKLTENFSEEYLISQKGSVKHGPFSLCFNGISPHIIARGLSDRYSICTRSGFHCAQPLHQMIGKPASLRLSFWLYNSEADIDATIDGIKQIVDLVNIK
ncbi:aminotransferase class V-fold PLP-dependent enzyme [Paraglaciecola sp.]|uniref:aminotransferase class V-fold PLP-dependent enzyme n=1 Tax=Paraglaciecola sp. TaxID=1920173 RepID=UPI003EF639CC